MGLYLNIKIWSRKSRNPENEDKSTQRNSFKIYTKYFFFFKSIFKKPKTYTKKLM